ncbi:hypothetical protein DFJ73DRAFT_84902 [Zopfochytrium polystomum]|nr:hypothetical protein DFJ73DRAFT_84902 [Zopfochytrium polystomum]
MTSSEQQLQPSLSLLSASSEPSESSSPSSSSSSPQPPPQPPVDSTPPPSKTTTTTTPASSMTTAPAANTTTTTTSTATPNPFGSTSTDPSSSSAGNGTAAATTTTANSSSSSSLESSPPSSLPAEVKVENVFKIIVGGSASFELPASTFSTFPGTFLHERTQRILHFNNPLTIDLPDCSPAVFRKVVLPFYDTSRPWEFPLAPSAPDVPPPTKGTIDDIIAAAAATATDDDAGEGEDSGDLNPFQIDHDLQFLCIPSPFDMAWSFATFFTTPDGKLALARGLQAARCVQNAHLHAVARIKEWTSLVEVLVAGTGNPPFTVVEGPLDGSTSWFHSISAMAEYAGWSFEELRVNDYVLGKRAAPATESSVEDNPLFHSISAIAAQAGWGLLEYAITKKKITEKMMMEARNNRIRLYKEAKAQQ